MTDAREAARIAWRDSHDEPSQHDAQVRYQVGGGWRAVCPTCRWRSEPTTDKAEAKERADAHTISENRD